MIKREAQPDDIILRVGVTDTGYLFLYDVVTGRSVSKVTDIEMCIVDPNQDIQRVTLTVLVDPRLMDDDAIEIARRAIEAGLPEITGLTLRIDGPGVSYSDQPINRDE